MNWSKKTIIIGLTFSLVIVLAIGMGLANAGDVTDDFELEGNILNDGVSTDWEDLFDVVGDNVPTPKAVLPAGFASPLFVRDFNPGEKGPDDSTFATGSKDALDINTGWECKRSNNVGDKFDIVNAYATAYINGDGDVILYFALERYSNEGDGNVGFWFLQDPNVGCVAPQGGSAAWTGQHVDGDLFIVSEFSKGGTLSSIILYEWSETLGTINPTPVLASTECGSGHDPAACAIVNDVDLPEVDIPWLTETKMSGSGASNDLAVSEFFEAGINLTDLGRVACFTGYVAVTRSSTSITATIHDYAFDKFELCGMEVSKVCPEGTAQDPNPIVDPADGESILTKFVVTIENTGIAPIYDVTLEEDYGFDVGEKCEIVAIGGSPVTPVDITDGAPYTVAASLGAHGQLEVEILCDTYANGFANIVTARAKSSASLLEPDLEETYTMPAEDICSVAVSPELSVDKECADLNDNETPDGVRLVKEGGLLVVEVVVDVEIENTGVEKLVDITLSDDQVTSFAHVDANGDPLPAFDGELIPGEKAYFTGSYKPSEPTSDGDGPFATCSNTTFEDTVTVNATGVISGNALDPVPWDSASCSLCVDCD